jgi:tRNA dimethylallyltransferase
VGIELARRLDAEIVSMDSMALYRGMDIGTAKPTADEMRRVPHHLIDVVDPDEEYSVARYLDEAAEAVRAIAGRGGRALFVGGTPLYLKSLLRGMFTGPEADWAIRRRLLHEVQERGEQALHARLRQIDPVAAERLHPHDVRRVIRALEVFELTGRPISQLQRQAAEPPVTHPAVFVLDWPRAKLHERIDHRVDAMFGAGLVDEVRSVSERWNLSHTALQAVGYREVLDHLEGRRDLDATRALVKTRTRQFAKRQMTWFRSLSECQFVPVDNPMEPAACATAIAERIARG